MATIFTYSITNDTLNGILAPEALSNQIRSSVITIALVGVTQQGDVLTIEFKANLSPTEETALDAVVAAHPGRRALEDAERVNLVDLNNKPVSVLDDSGIDRLAIDVNGMLNLGDGQVKVSSNDASADFLVGKITSAVPFVTFTEQNDGGSETLELGFDQSGILTSAITNDAAFIDAAGAPVQSVNGNVGVVVLDKTDVGLGSVPNVDATDADNVVVDPIPGVVPTGGDTQEALENIQTNVNNIINGTTPASHNQLTGLQGGQASEYFHLTSSEHNILRSGSQDATSLHNHDSRYYTQAQLDSGQLDNRYFTETETNALLALKQDLSEKGQPNGYASLDGNGLVPTSQLPALAVSSTFVVADIPARDALPVGPSAGQVQEGDIVVVLDASADPQISSGRASYIYDGSTYVRLSTIGSVDSVNGQTGVVILDSDDISEGGANQYFTEERAQDAVGNNLVDSSTIDLTYDDGANTITADYIGELNDNSDVTISSPTNLDVLQYNGTNWFNAPLLSSNEKIVNQPGHGFTLTNNIPIPAYNDLTGTVIAAQADDFGTLSAYYITRIIDADNFVIQNNGIIDAPGHGLKVGCYYFLSDTVAGDVTDVQPTVTIQDTVFFIVDANCIILIDNLPVDKPSIEKFLIKVSNTNTTTNLNTAGFTEVPITGTTEINEFNFYTVVGNGIQVPVQRTYRITANIYVGTNTTRSNQRLRFHVNGVARGAIAAHGYIRDSFGHNESSYSLEEVFALNAGDIVTVESQQEAAGGTVSMVSAGTSIMIIEAR
jgi:hypothetical protein